MELDYNLAAAKLLKCPANIAQGVIEKLAWTDVATAEGQKGTDDKMSLWMIRGQTTDIVRAVKRGYLDQAWTEIAKLPVLSLTDSRIGRGMKA